MTIEFDRTNLLASTSVLMLSTGFEPLFRTSWKRAINAVYGGRAEIIETHSSLFLMTSSGAVPFPTKVRFVTGIIAARIKNFNRNAKLSKRNIFIRDNGKCQYCRKEVTIKSSTIDHVIPKSKNGDHTWENVVLSCTKCNQKKGAKLPRECGMVPDQHPHAPSVHKVLVDFYI